MMELMWLGQMGLIIRSENTTLCIDYYATDDGVNEKNAVGLNDGETVRIGRHPDPSCRGYRKI